MLQSLFPFNPGCALPRNRARCFAGYEGAASGHLADFLLAEVARNSVQVCNCCKVLAICQTQLTNSGKLSLQLGTGYTAL